MLIDNVAFAVDDEHIRYHLYAKGALEVAVGVEEHFVGTSVVVDERFHLVDVLCLVDADGDDFDAGLLLPLVIDFADGGELTVAGFAPGGEEVDDEGLAVVGECVGADGFSVHGLEGHGRELSVSSGDDAHQCHYDDQK